MDRSFPGRQNPEPLPIGSATAPGFSASDVAIASGLLALTLSVCIPVAMHLRQRAGALDRERGRSVARSRQLNDTIYTATRRLTVGGTKRAAINRFVVGVENRSLVPWATVVTELSARRPKGLWTTSIRGEGPRFQVQVAAERPELVGQYMQTLMKSPYVEFASLPAGEGAAAAQVIGRIRGE